MRSGGFEALEAAEQNARPFYSECIGSQGAVLLAVVSLPWLRWPSGLSSRSKSVLLVTGEKPALAGHNTGCERRSLQFRGRVRLRGGFTRRRRVE